MREYLLSLPYQLGDCGCTNEILLNPGFVVAVEELSSGCLVRTSFGDSYEIALSMDALKERLSEAGR